jgi:hypothetical protein
VITIESLVSKIRATKTGWRFHFYKDEPSRAQKNSMAEDDQEGTSCSAWPSSLGREDPCRAGALWVHGTQPTRWWIGHGQDSGQCAVCVASRRESKLLGLSTATGAITKTGLWWALVSVGSWSLRGLPAKSARLVTSPAVVAWLCSLHPLLTFAALPMFRPTLALPLKSFLPLLCMHPISVRICILRR